MMTYSEFLLEILNSSTDVVTAAYNTGRKEICYGAVTEISGGE